MPELKKLLESTMKVRFHDCDPFNHLNNSRYLDYMMAARTDQLLDNYGFDLNAFAQEQGIGWVTAHTQISYRLPASFMEEVLVQTRLMAFSEKTLQFEAVMYSQHKTQVKAVMWSRLVHFNLRSKQSHRHTDALMNFFAQVANPLPTDTSFDERINTIQ